MTSKEPASATALSAPVLAAIASFLEVRDHVSMAQVCVKFRAGGQQRSSWPPLVRLTGPEVPTEAWAASHNFHPSSLFIDCRKSRYQHAWELLAFARCVGGSLRQFRVTVGATRGHGKPLPGAYWDAFPRLERLTIDEHPALRIELGALPLLTELDLWQNEQQSVRWQPRFMPKLTRLQLRNVLYVFTLSLLLVSSLLLKWCCVFGV